MSEIYEIINSSTFLVMSNFDGDYSDLIRQFTTHMFFNKGYSHDEIGQIINSLLEREAKQTTALTDGTALPHACTNLIRSRAETGFCLIRNGVDFGSWDGKPSKLFFFTIYACSEKGLHLELLCIFAKMIRIIKWPIEASTSEDLRNYIIDIFNR